MPDKNGFTYAGSGVDISAGDALVERIKPLARITNRPGAAADIGGFSGIFDLKAAGFRDPLLVATTDGVGTKVKIAAMTGIHRTIGIDLVAMCVNDLAVQGAEPLFFLDYYATGKLDPAVGVEIVKGIAQGCIEAGAALIGGETAEMPGLYGSNDYDLAGFAAGAVERDKLLPRDDMEEGDAVLGLPSAGLHSNGFSLVREVVAKTYLTWGQPAPFARGQLLGEALLAPTRIYVKPVLRALAQMDGIKALAHITGGGFSGNIPRVLPKKFGAEINLAAIPVPQVFGWLAAEGGISQQEMLRTFNCGIGMVAVARSQKASEVMQAFERAGEKPVMLGQITMAKAGARVTFRGELNL